MGDPPLVTTTNLDTGESTAWTDSVVILDDGSLGTIFFALLEVQAGDTYRMDVRDGAEAITRATTKVPSTAGLAAGTPSRVRSGDLIQPLIWEDLRRGREAHVHYRVLSLPSSADTTIVLTYAGSGEITALGWSIGVMLDRDYRLVRRFIENARGDTALVLIDVSMSIEALSPEWVVTGDATNIENGSGFFASVGRFRESWTLDSTTIRSIGFRAP